MKFKEDHCQTVNAQPIFNTTMLAATIFFAVIVVIIVISTAFDVFHYYSQTKPSSPTLTTFSLLTNGKHLISVSNGQNQIGCLHGIRVISTMWIIIRHRYSIQSSFPTTDYFYEPKWLNREGNMYMINASIAVDTFFLLAGMLISYNYLISNKKGRNFNIVIYYIHRYVRLTPVIISLILIYVAFLRHMGSGPLWPIYIENDLVVGCETYWWKALLFVQNYGYQSSMCIPHSWYLCVDMQLFILSPVILLPLKRWPKVTIMVTSVLTACSALSGFIVGFILELNFIESSNKTIEKSLQYIHHYYFSTPVRAAPWLIGLTLGYYVFEFKQQNVKVELNKVLVISLWLVSFTIMCACVLAGHDLLQEYEKIGSSMHMALVKPSWAIGISWIIYACTTGYGGPINWFLSLPFFEVLSKLTYTLYLVHYAIIYILIAQMRETVTINNFQVMHGFWGDFVFSVAASILLMLSFELPFSNLERLLLKKWEKN